MKVCQDKNCKCYGQKLVDRGYGHPVCPSTSKTMTKVDVRACLKKIEQKKECGNAIIQKRIASYVSANIDDFMEAFE